MVRKRPRSGSSALAHRRASEGRKGAVPSACPWEQVRERPPSLLAPRAPQNTWGSLCETRGTMSSVQEFSEPSMCSGCKNMYRMLTRPTLF